nr:MAG TPA: hypothetical protein [Caudoviricetes sp.]
MPNWVMGRGFGLSLLFCSCEPRSKDKGRG